MKCFNRIISTSLALVICLSMCLVPASAAGASGSITVRTEDSYTHQTLDDVGVKLENLTAGKYEDYGIRYSFAGSLTFPTLKEGWYRITPVASPYGYENLSDTEAVYLRAGQALSVTVSNKSLKSINVLRMDIEKNIKLAGAEFEVKDSKNLVIGTYVTGANGYATIPNLSAGTYTVTETKAPEGYNKANAPQAATVVATASRPVELLFHNSELGSISIYNLAKSSGLGIAGAKFKLTLANGTVVKDNLITDATGLISVGGLTAGTYVISQTAVGEGYTGALQSRTVALSASKNNISEIFESTKPGSLTVSCSDSKTGLPISGATIKLYSQTNVLIETKQQTGASVLFSNLANGSYIVVASVPDSHLMDEATKITTVSADTESSVVFTATNKPILRVISLDANTNAPVPGVKVNVSTMGGQFVTTAVTGADGTVLVSGLNSGYYVLEVISVPNGYVFETSSRAIRVSPGETTDVTVLTRAKPYIVVESYIRGTNTPLAGMSYELFDENNVLVATGVSDATGRTVFEALAPGAYTIKNTQTPPGFTLVTPSQAVSVSTTTAGRAVFLGAKQSSVLIQALNKADGAPIPGAIFQILNQHGMVQEQLTTGGDGCAVSNAMDAGTYIVRLLWVPNEFSPDLTSSKIEIVDNKTAISTFTASEKKAITIYANESDGTPVVGAKYTITNAVTGREVQQVTTDGSGIAITNLLDNGIYIVTEIVVPSGYLLASPTQVKTIIAGEAGAVARFQHFAQSTIRIQTFDMTTGVVVPGATYSVDNMDGTHIGDFVADEAGEVKTDRLPSGKYLVKQTVAPIGYALDKQSQIATITSEQVCNLRFANQKLSGIIIENVVQGTHTPLAGCAFEIYDDSAKLVFHGTTTETGLLTAADLPSGLYTIKQVSSADGFAIIEPTKSIHVTTNEATYVVFENKALTGLFIELVDKTTKEALSGSKFKVSTIGGEFVAEVTVNNGVAVVPNLAPGSYTVSQATAPDGYVLSNDYQIAKMVTGFDTHVKFTNERLSSITIQCLDRNTSAGLAGGKFAIYELNGKLITELIAGNTGIVQTGLLAPGQYLIKELTVPTGYLADTETQTVTVTTGLTTTATFNHVAIANVTVRATDSASGVYLPGATFNLTTQLGDFVGQYTSDRNGQVVIANLALNTYLLTPIKAPSGYVLNSTPYTIVVKANTPVLQIVPFDRYSGVQIFCTVEQTGQPISGVSMKITTVNGVLVGNYKTNGAGKISVDLEPGVYVVYETYVPEGYVINDTPVNFTVGTNRAATVEIENRKLSEMRVKVVDAETRKPIYNVSLEVKDSRNNYVGTWRTDNDGYFYMSKVLGDGRYILTMLNVPSGYIKDTVSKTVILDMYDPTEVIWAIEPVKGQVQITTLSESDNALMGIYKGSRLADAVYAVVDRSGRTVATIQGNAYGEAYSGALPVGTYFIQQITAPSGFTLNPAKVTVNVASTNDNIKLTVYNKAANFAVTVNAHGSNSAYAGTQTKYYFTNIKNASSANASDFYMNIKLPTDAVRAGTLYTGTWSQSTAYYIEYKTNLSGQARQLATGLNSKSQYSYDLSSKALALTSNEYVTEVRFVFPTVVAGFHESMAPSLYATILPTVPNGYQIINRVEVGAKFGTQWTTAAATWTTVCASLRTPPPSMLPKTGY